MKATNINNTKLKELIIGLNCGKCQQKFTKEEIERNNYSLWFESEGEAVMIGNDKKGWQLSIDIREITHEWDEKYPSVYDCPDNEKCTECFNTFRANEVKKGIGEDDTDDYYCDKCFQAKYGEYLKERAKMKKITPEQKEVMRIVQKAISEHLESNWHHGGNDYDKCKGSECEGYKLTLESYGYERN